MTNQKSNFLGIDYGSRKVGLAFAPGGVLAVGFKIINNDKDFFARLKKIVEENEIGKIIVGLPVSLDGAHSIKTKEVARFIQKLEKFFSEQEIFSYDERFTTQEAQRNIGLRREDDAEAARIILQGFLDKNSF